MGCRCPWYYQDTFQVISELMKKDYQGVIMSFIALENGMKEIDSVVVDMYNEWLDLDESLLLDEALYYDNYI